MTEPNEQPGEEQEPRAAEPTPEEQEALEREQEPTPEGEPAEGEPAEGEQGAADASTEASAEPQGLTEKEIEQRFAKLDKEAKRHRDRLSEILGEDALELIPCELCWPPAPGFRFPQMPEEQKSAVMTAIGFEPGPQLLPDKRAHACPDCDGHGAVATGSKVRGQDALPCIDCAGSGWVGERRTAPVSTVTSALPDVAVNGPAPVAPSDPDREALRQAAIAAGFMLTDTRAPATA